MDKSRFGNVAVIVLIAVLAASGLMLNIAASRYQRGKDHSLSAQRLAQQALTLAVDAETGQRGYLVTGEDDYLEPYLRAKSDIYRTLASLRSLVSDNPTQMERLDEIRATVDSRLAVLQRTVDAKRAGDAAGAVAIVKSGEGKRMMDIIRKDLAQFSDTEAQLAEDKLKLATLMRQGAYLSAILMGLVLFVQLIRETRQATRESQKLVDDNNSLERIVSERTQELEREKTRVEALLADITHRVGNNLAIVGGLISLQARQFADPEVKQAFAGLRSRIDAIALGQRKFQLRGYTDEIDGVTHIQTLVDELQLIANQKKIRIETELDPIGIPAKDALSYVVLINELVTNALKHAFPGKRRGTITVRLKQSVGDSDNGMTLLSVEDDGAGQADKSDKPSMGQKIIQLMLKSLSATMQIGHATGTTSGYRTTIFIPAGNGVV